MRYIRLVSLALGLLILGSTASQSQIFSVLYNFGTNSGYPEYPSNPGVIAEGRDGNLYSTTPVGGTGSNGAAFKITPSGNLTLQYSFDATSGQFPDSGLTLGMDGNFYGATTLGYGTLFRLQPNGQVIVVHNFTGSDGSDPTAPPVQGFDGNFYGTTAAGGSNNCGTVYKLTPSGTFTSLYTFDCFTTGGVPYAPLVQGTDGSFYGTTYYGLGNVFRITASGKFTVLYTFDQTHGSAPFAPLIQGNDGNFYGTASAGGSGCCGTVFRITPSGTLTVMHSFAESSEGYPYAGLVQATDGNFYGTTTGQPPNSCGTIFQITAKEVFSTLYNFNTGTNGCGPEVSLVQHTNGLLYGDTYMGGNGAQCSGLTCGVFFGLNVGLKPFIATVPEASKVGRTIGILGGGFKGTTVVSFNGTSATFTVNSNTYLTTTVPNDATTGFVTVTTPSGVLTSNKEFLVIP
jgi:uncharacterized repeat protein (TIGR03803 family)